LSYFSADEQGQFAPFPVAIDVVKANFAEPAELGFDVEKLVGRIFVSFGDPESLEEAVMNARGWRGDVFEVAEDSATKKKGPDLRVELAFALVGKMVNGEAGNHRIEAAEGRQGLGHVVRNDLDAAVLGKSGSGIHEHWFGEVEGHTFGLRTFEKDQREQSSITAAEIENALRVFREFRQESFFALGPVGQFIGAPKVFESVFEGLPFAGHAEVLDAGISGGSTRNNMLAHRRYAKNGIDDR
jgi:hypothetical protein